VQNEKWDFYNSSRLVELTYPLKLLESQGKKLLLGTIGQRNSKRKKKSQEEEGNVEATEKMVTHLHSRRVAHCETHFRLSIETRLQSSCTWYPALRKIGFSCAFPQFKLSSRRRKNWISAPCDALHHLSLPN